jgi:CubicO group peptidase (beta-lactamase class C family)
MSACFSCTQQVQGPKTIPVAQIEEYLKQVYNAYPLPGLVVVMVHGDQSKSFTYGYSQLKDSLLFTDSSMFFAGKLSEVVVADMALQLQREGKLMMNDHVADRIPYFKMEGDYRKISLHHLLTHTSGISNFSPAWDLPTYESDALENTTKSIVYLPLDFDPGTQAKYSPYNIDIAADLFQNISDLSFEELMSDQYFKPLGLSSSTFDFRHFDSALLVKPHHIGHWLSYNQKENEFYPYTRENVGSYGFHTSAADLKSWMGSKLLKGDQELFTKHYQTAKDIYKGYGWEIFKSSSEVIYNNHWVAGGFSADISLIPDKQLGVFVFANTEGDFNPATISSELIKLLEGKTPLKVRPPIHIAMSKMLAEGRCMAEVLAWCSAELQSSDSDYEINAMLLGQLGVNLLHRVNMPQEALEVFRFAIEKYPDSPQAYLNLSEGLLMTNNLEEANNSLSNAMKLGQSASDPLAGFLREQIDVALENRYNL